MNKITANFKLSEFSCKCGCGENRIDLGIIHRLQVVRDILGVPIIILSGWRCLKHNQEVGGAPDSYHLTGQAADWTCSIIKNAAMLLSETWSGGFHYYAGKNFIHTDTGPKRRW